MIKYSSKDIITRAEQLADLENSDFISDYEKLALLNESWQMLYQKIIETNDKTFIKSVPAANNMNLPNDFYQLSALYIEQTKEQIEKINSSELNGYEIRNNRLILSKCYVGAKIVLEYYPVPPTLFLREKTIDCPFSNDIKAASHTLYIDNTNTIKDLNDNSVDFKIADEFDDYALFSNGAIFEKNGNYYFVNYENSEIAQLTDDFIPFVINNVLYVYNKSTKQILDDNNNIYLEKDFNLDNETYYVYCDEEFKNIYQFTDDGYYYNSNEKVNLSSRKLKLIWSNNNPYTITDTNRLVKCETDRIRIIPTEYIPYTFISEKYVMTKKKMSSLCYLEGILEDTELDYPNNLFFVMLSYVLAIAFKTKQGSDTTALSGLYAQAETQFFNSLSRDANDNYRIKNMNRGRQWI